MNETQNNGTSIGFTVQGNLVVFSGGVTFLNGGTVTNLSPEQAFARYGLPEQRVADLVQFSENVAGRILPDGSIDIFNKRTATFANLGGGLDFANPKKGFTSLGLAAEINFLNGTPDDFRGQFLEFMVQ